MNKLKFTKTGIAALPIPSRGRVEYYDAEIPGLIVRVTDKGAKSFNLVRRCGGKLIRMNFGRFPATSVENARKAATAACGKLAQGIDPRAERRAKLAPQPKEPTMQQLWDYYLENHAKPKKRSWREDEKRYLRHLEAWKGRKLADIQTADVERLHRKIGKTAPYEANRTLALLKCMFGKFASKVGFHGANPCKGIERFDEDQRERFLQADEFPKFFAGLEKLAKDSPVVADALEVSLWTGARKGNVISMTWDELALQRAEWTIPGSKHKNGKPVIVHLPSPALDILLRRQQTAGDSPWVFPGRRRGKPLFDVYKPWRALLAESGLKDLRPHDLRRTMGSWETATGASIQIVGKTLGHRPGSQATAVYARMNLSTVKDAVNKAVEAIQAAKNTGGDNSHRDEK